MMICDSGSLFWATPCTTDIQNYLHTGVCSTNFLFKRLVHGWISAINIQHASAIPAMV